MARGAHLAIAADWEAQALDLVLARFQDLLASASVLGLACEPVLVSLVADLAVAPQA